MINVLPITTRKPDKRTFPNEVPIYAGMGGLTRDSIILCYQIRTLDKKRLIRDMGKIEDHGLQENIIEALSFQLGITRQDNHVKAIHASLWRTALAGMSASGELVQAFSALYPAGTDEKRWVEGLMAKKKGLGF